MSDSSRSASALVDVAIVGAGPTGLSCAIEIIKRGRSVIVFDKGCLVNSLYNYPTNLTFFAPSFFKYLFDSKLDEKQI